MAKRFSIFGMKARDFERAMCALFRGQGYTVTGFAGGGTRLDSGTVAPQVERRLQGGVP